MNFSPRIIAVCVLSLFLVSCTTLEPKTRYRSSQDGPPAYDVDVAHIPDAIPKVEPFSKYGNPRCYVALGKRYYVMHSNTNFHQRGIASWYGTKFHAHRTSSGERYDMLKMTAAHKTLPIPTYAMVTNLENSRRVVVKINDRGPFKPNRIIDLSYAAAKKLGILARGTGLVQIDAIDARTWHGGGLTNYFTQHQTLSPTENCPVIDTISSHPQLYTQLGAFATYHNAQLLAARVKRYTRHGVRLQSALVGGRKIYRVQIGPLKNVEESDALNRSLSHLGFGSPITTIQ